MGEVPLFRGSIPQDLLEKDAPHKVIFDAFDESLATEGLSIYTAVLGSVVASFLIPTDSFWENAYSEVHTKDRSDFAKGLVDDELYKPFCYRAQIDAPGYVAFCLSGYDPQAHLFETVSPERQSIFHVARRGPRIPFAEVFTPVG